MKTKDKEALKNLTPAELGSELRQAREKRFSLEFRHKMTPLTDPLELRALRRKIALLETVSAQKARAAKPAK
ncbi:MAG: 50S ribosomal protein L29 [Elusimicrobiales bacterium]